MTQNPAAMTGFIGPGTCFYFPALPTIHSIVYFAAGLRSSNNVPKLVISSVRLSTKAKLNGNASRYAYTVCCALDYRNIAFSFRLYIIQRLPLIFFLNTIANARHNRYTTPRMELRWLLIRKSTNLGLLSTPRFYTILYEISITRYYVRILTSVAPKLFRVNRNCWLIVSLLVACFRKPTSAAAVGVFVYMFVCVYSHYHHHHHPPTHFTLLSLPPSITHSLT